MKQDGLIRHFAIFFIYFNTHIHFFVPLKKLHIYVLYLPMKEPATKAKKTAKNLRTHLIETKPDLPTIQRVSEWVRE